MNDMSPSDPAPKAPAGKLTQGSMLGHIVSMTSAGAVGLVAIFAVDFLSLFYISLLGDERLTAGVGYATTVMFFALSVNIGLMIAGGALVARARGARDIDRARRVAASSALFQTLAGALVSILLLATMHILFDALGADGVPRAVAERFLWIALPSTALMSLGMAYSSVLRAAGDARRSMMVTLLGGVATAVLDPLLIFGLGLGTDGAAIATVLSRIVFCVIGFRGVCLRHKLMARPTLADLKRDMRPLLAIAVPAVLTNIASPIAATFMLGVVRQFGHEAVTASTIIDRIVPLAFGVLFALSGSVGPILAQNLGAGRFDRLRQGLRDALIFGLSYSLFAWAMLALFRHPIAALFGASEKTAAYISFFCLVGSAGWAFNALLFVSNAAFNNLGFPLYSTFFNWGRATLGTMPFCLVGAYYWGYEGAIGLVSVGWGIFGAAAMITAFRAVGRLETQARTN